ncbi:MAG: MFS transporter [Acidobacteria bacterium]|nr:MFS transporter [Acidobacteriota bacterium]
MHVWFVWTVESWLNDRASNATRGRLLSIYMLVVTLGLAAGQFLLGSADPSGTKLFLVAGILTSLGVVPVALIKIPTPRRPIPVEVSLGALVKKAPLGVVAVALSGAAGSSILALGAVFATNVGMAPGKVGLFMAASLAGAVVTQYPLGYLSDRFPRRRVILVVAGGAVVAAVFAIPVASDNGTLFVLMSLYGALAFPMYSLAVSHINDVIPEDQLVQTAAGIIFVFGIGSVVGPLTISVAMTVFGPVGYLWGLAAFFLPVTVYALVRVVFRDRPIQRRFINLPHRSSTAAAMLADRSREKR